MFRGCFGSGLVPDQPCPLRVSIPSSCLILRLQSSLLLIISILSILEDIDEVFTLGFVSGRRFLCKVGTEKSGTYGADHLPGLIDYRYCFRDIHYGSLFELQVPLSQILFW